MGKYIDFEFLKQNNPNPMGIQYKGLFGDRSIGKTHGVMKHLVNSLKDGECLLILRRNKLELNFNSFVTKYSNALKKVWKIDGDKVVQTGYIDENGDEISHVPKIIAYFSALSLAERCKNNNYDNPFISNIIVDEVFAEKPNKGEFQQLQTWIGTVSRRTGESFHPISVWLLGNTNYGLSPILDGLGIATRDKEKIKTSDGVYLFSKMNSPEGTINVKHPLIKEIQINDTNEPILSWNLRGNNFALYDCTNFIYIKQIEKNAPSFNTPIMKKIQQIITNKKGFPQFYVSNYMCFQFVMPVIIRANEIG